MASVLYSTDTFRLMACTKCWTCVSVGLVHVITFNHLRLSKFSVHVSVLVLCLYECFTPAMNVFLNFIILQEKRQTSYEYGRYGNPTSTVLEEKIRFVCLFDLI